MSNIIPLNLEEPSWIFASITNLGSVFTHEIRLGGPNGLSPELISWKSVSHSASPSILSTAAKVMSSLLFSNYENNQKTFGGNLDKAKLDLSEDHVLTIVTDSYVEELKIILSGGSFQAKTIWHAIIPDNLSIIDAIVASNTSDFRAVLGLWHDKVIQKIYLRVFQYDAQSRELKSLEKIEIEQLPRHLDSAFGRIFKLNKTNYYIVLSSSVDHNVVFKAEG